LRNKDLKGKKCFNFLSKENKKNCSDRNEKLNVQLVHIPFNDKEYKNKFNMIN